MFPQLNHIGTDEDERSVIVNSERVANELEELKRQGKLIIRGRIVYR